MRVVVIGATGLVGALLVRRLLADAGIGQVHVIGRHAGGVAHARLREHVAPPAEWFAITRGIGADAAVSALGKTMRAAGGRDAFRSVDHGMVTAFARGAFEGGASRMVAVSSVGADAASRSFYLRVKGETELDLREVGFTRLDVLRPGTLRGARVGVPRTGERIWLALTPVTELLLRGPLARYAAIDATSVARAAAACVRREEPGRFVHENREMLALAGGA